MSGGAVPLGMPLLSGPPPVPTGSEKHCRRCAKEISGIIGGMLMRPKRCQHCGYQYCSSCADYQALSPRIGDGQSGYEVVHVCGFCQDYLALTASGRNQLRSLPLQKLKQYLDAYNIDRKGALEKDDLVDKIISARGSNGCLSAENENYYRQHSVPNKAEPGNTANSRPNIFRRAYDATASYAQPQPPPPNQTPQQPRPPPRQPPRPAAGQRGPPHHGYQPDFLAQPQFNPAMGGPYGYAPYHGYPPTGQPPAQRQAYAPPSGMPPYANTPSPRPPSRPPPNHYSPPSGPPPGSSPYSQPSAATSHGHIPRPSNPSTPQSRPRASSTSGPRPTPVRHSPPVPSLDELLAMPEDAVRKLSISALKEVLHRNHVLPGQVLEKSDLIEKVLRMLADERMDRARDAALRDREEEEMRRAMEQSAQEAREEEARRAQPSSGASAPAAGSTPSESLNVPGSGPRPMSPQAQAKAATLERNGLCVICTDEEANIAIVDCGHLCMCRGCSELIMSSTRECPLCRTRIVTEQRLLRIFRS